MTFPHDDVTLFTYCSFLKKKIGGMLIFIYILIEYLYYYYYISYVYFIIVWQFVIVISHSNALNYGNRFPVLMDTGI